MLLGVDGPLAAELLGLGCGAGFLAGLLGVGGGMMLVPFLTLILSQRGVAADLAVKMAIATAMATILFTSLSSLRAHHRLGAVRWDLVRGLAPGIVIVGLATGALLFPLIKGPWLALLFALFVGFSATQMLLDKKPKPGRQMPGLWGRLGAGGLIGFLSGLVGAGGAFVSVPFMTWCNVPIRNAVATSAALGFPIALASSVGNLIGGWGQVAPLPGTFGYLYLPALALLATASVSMAPLGARAAHTMNRTHLKRLFALLLYGLASYMLYKGMPTN
jgi:uncharacterized membrane protein YfcA